MALTPEQIAEQLRQAQLAQERQRKAQEAQLKAAAEKASGLEVQEGVTPAVGQTVQAQGATPALTYTPALGMPKTAQVRSVGFESTAGSGGKGSGGGGSGGLSIGGGDSGGGEGESSEAQLEENIVLKSAGALTPAGAPPAIGQTTTNFIKTPYGNVTGTVPRSPDQPHPTGYPLGSPISNQLTQERTFDRVRAAADAYRDLPANASPTERAAARQEYAASLASRAEGLPSTSISQAFGMPQRVPDAAGIAKYNASLERKGINPYRIGGARITAAGGLDVPTIAEETSAMNTAEKAAKTLRDFQAQERRARAQLREVKRKGSKEDKEKAQVALDEASEKSYQFGIESGAIDPRNPTAGMNVDRMRQVALMLRDPSSLAGQAQQRIQASALAQKKMQEQQPVDRTQQELAEITARNRQANEIWLEEQRRRQQQMFGNLYANNY